MKMRKTELLKEAEEKNRLLHRQYVILQKNYAANAQLFHDMNHHLQVIYHLAEKGKAKNPGLYRPCGAPGTGAVRLRLDRRGYCGRYY